MHQSGTTQISGGLEAHRQCSVCPILRDDGRWRGDAMQMEPKTISGEHNSMYQALVTNAGSWDRYRNEVAFRMPHNRMKEEFEWPGDSIISLDIFDRPHSLALGIVQQRPAECGGIVSNGTLEYFKPLPLTQKLGGGSRCLHVIPAFVRSSLPYKTPCPVVCGQKFQSIPSLSAASPQYLFSNLAVQLR